MNIDEYNAIRRQQLSSEEEPATPENSIQGHPEQISSYKSPEPTVPEPQTPTTSHGSIDPKEFGLLENAQEAANAVVGGGIDAINSVGSIPKFFDPNFYKQDTAANPYKFQAPWIINKKPITRTVWGSFIRQGTELAAGLVGTGKVMWGIKGARKLMTAAKATRMGRVGLGAVQGGIYDVVSNQSQEQNLARTLIDIKPQWSEALTPFATTEDMSPAQRSIYNFGEGLGLGGFFDIASEAIGIGSRAASQKWRKVFKSNLEDDKLLKKLLDNSDYDYDLKTQDLERVAKATYERSMYRKSKSKIGIESWRKKNDPWKELKPEQKEMAMQKIADSNDIDWGPERKLERRGTKQKEAHEQLSIEQLEVDLSKGKARQNPAYYNLDNITENNALSSSTKPMKGVRDQIQIRNDFSQKYGSPRGTLTEAHIRRIEYNAPGTILKDRNALAKRLEADPAYKELYKGADAEVITQDISRATVDLTQFISDSGHSRLIDIPEEDVIKYIKDKDANKPSVIEGIGILNKSQLTATDVILGQLLYESRDLAKAALSVAPEISARMPGSVLDGILARYTAVARMRKETSLLSSFNFARFKSGIKDSSAAQAARARASDVVANEVSNLKVLLQNDPSEELLETFLHFTATSNGSKQAWKDMQAFMSHNLHGYRNGDQYTRNAIIGELQVMGMNSMLSGPKTPVRALAGTGLGTVMRPVATIIGSSGDYLKGQDEVTRGAFANLAGMVASINDSWRKAVADFQSYNLNPEGFRGYTATKSDREWLALKEYTEQYGSEYDKAVYRTTDWLRWLNKVPLFNYGPRIMKAQDSFFTNMIARGRVKQLAFNDVYDRLKRQNLTVSDNDFADLIKAAEGHFEGEVFSADGRISDSMVKFASDEAKLTKELTGRVKSLERVFDRSPFLKPFFLFARTGVNALEMTSKYTPILNKFIKEHVDISTRSWDDPELLKYGIKTIQDLELAKATMRGRVAIGNGVAFTAAWAALNGKITGNGPPDRQLRNSWIQNGWQPRSIKVGGSYISYESLEPFNMILSFTADVVDGQLVMGDEWAENWYGRLAYLISANVTNRTFLAGLLQFQDLWTSKGGDSSRILGMFLNNQVPLSSFRNEMGKLLSPGMRELESGIGQTIGNRNLWTDLIANEETGKLPYKYDILSGNKIKSYDPITRFYNAISPFQINLGTTPTKELLFRSGLNLKQTFNTGPRGISLKHLPDLRSKFQFLMSQQRIEEKLRELFNNPAVVQSIYDMEADRAAGRVGYDPKDTVHGELIKQIFTNAKKRAWQQLLREHGQAAERLEELHHFEELESQTRKKGQTKRANLIRQEIENLKSLIYK